MLKSLPELNEREEYRTPLPVKELEIEREAILQGIESIETVDPTVANEHELSLVAMLQHEARARACQTIGAFTIAGAMLVAIKLLLPRLELGESAFRNNVGICLALLYGSGGVFVLHAIRRSYQLKKPLADKIARIADKSQVGSLVRALRVDNTAVKNIAKVCLTDLLPQFNASDSDLLGETERSILMRLLSIPAIDKGTRDLRELYSRAADRREILLRISILKALEQVGGAKELPVVARLAREPYALKRDKTRLTEVTNAALECLPYLQSRTNEQLASAQLLRASTSELGLANTLLHPVEHADNVPPEEHLRAAQ